MNPSKVIFELGETQFGQGLQLEMEMKSGQRPTWTLIQHASSQRDDTQRIHLTERQIVSMGAAVAGAKRT